MSSDSFKRLVPVLYITASDGPEERFVGYFNNLTYQGDDYYPMPTLEFTNIQVSGDVQDKECVITGLKAETPLLAGLYSHRQYASVRVKIGYAEFDPVTFEMSNYNTVFFGKVYNVKPRVFCPYLSITCKEMKYYADMVAGISCTEQCSAPFYGDTKICRRPIYSFEYTVVAVNGLKLTVSDNVTESEYAFNKGYASLDGVAIGIKYWRSGLTFDMRTAPPSSWVGEVVKFHHGCDKSVASCRRWGNTHHFFGLGYGMIDYDPKYSTG
jgi:hypothetical protein